MNSNYTRISFEMSQEDALLLKWFDGETPAEIMTGKVLDRVADIKRGIVEGKLARIAQAINIPVWVLAQQALEEKVKNLQAEHSLSDDHIKPTCIATAGGKQIKSRPDGFDIPDFSQLAHTPSELIPKP